MSCRVRPNEEGRVLLKRSEAAWLARVSTETVRRWIDDDRTLPAIGEGRSSRIDWADLCTRASKAGELPPTHWSWLDADMTRPLNQDGPSREAKATPPSTDEVANLRAENAALRLERDIAAAEAENLDQAVMVYRDNWLRRTQPQSPQDIDAH